MSNPAIASNVRIENTTIPIVFVTRIHLGLEGTTRLSYTGLRMCFFPRGGFDLGIHHNQRMNKNVNGPVFTGRLTQKKWEDLRL